MRRQTAGENAGVGAGILRLRLLCAYGCVCCLCRFNHFFCRLSFLVRVMRETVAKIVVCCL